MIREGAWSDAQHDALVAELNALVDECWEDAVTYGTMTEGPWLDKNELFEDVFKDMPLHLIRQREELRDLEDH
jgi:2-oxoisovalerate dehydrogenase E1 component alpha subunit